MDAVAVPQMYPVRLKPLGKGSYGAVFVGEIPGGVCAVKEVHETLAEEKEGWEGPGRIIDMFKQECDFIGKLRHPHIVQFFGLYSKENLHVPALVTEKLSTDLDSLLLTTPPSAYFPLGLKFSILRDVAGGLLYLHSQTPPIIHRDLTARNVLLDAAMVAKIADFGMARLVPDGTSRLTQTPGNYCYMPPEAMGSDCKYDESLDVFSFGVLALFTLTEKFPEPKGVKSTKDGKVVSRSEVERRHTFFETLRNEVEDQDGVVEGIEKCLSDTPKGRPEVQRMLSLMQSAKEKNLTEELKMNKLELVRIIKREQDDFKEKHDKLRREEDELRSEKDELKRERDELRVEQDKLRKEKDVLRSEGNKFKREQSELKEKRDELKKERDELKRERDELEGEENVLRMERDELRSERDRLKGERDELRSERDKLKGKRDELRKERDKLRREREALEEEQNKLKREKDEHAMQVAEIITQMKQEKEEAVKQKEREIVEELRETQRGKPREKEEAVKQKERGINEELREELCAKPRKPNLRIVMTIIALLSIGILSVFLLMQVQVQVSGIGEGVSLIHNEAQCPGTFLQPNRTETSEEYHVQCDKCKKEQVKYKEERECKKEQVTRKEERDDCKKEQVTCKEERDVTCKEERDECKKKQVMCKEERDECKKEQVTYKEERDECKKEQVTCKEERDVTCKEERDECKKKQVMCKEERDECKKEQVTYKEERDECNKEQVTCKGERDECKKEQVTCKEERDECKKEQVTCKGERDECKKEQVKYKEERDQWRGVKKEVAVMIIGSIIPPRSGWIMSAVEIPQSPASPSHKDRQVLKKLGLPLDQWDNLNALLALYNKTENYDVFPPQVSKPGMELSRSYILEQIELLLAKQQFKKVILHYYGNGRRNTGDWCFRDGTITFRDIAHLYMKHGRGRGLTIVSDCHSSGRWVSQCAEFLDEQGVKPCGHSAREKGILLKVYASCQTGQDSAELHYITRAMELRENGYVYHYLGKKLSAQQRTIGVDFTKVRCGKGKEEECSIAPDVTWSTAWEVISHRIRMIRRKHRGHPKWFFFVLDDDKIKYFKDEEYIDLKEYGKVLKSGRGKNPSPEDRAWINRIIERNSF